MDFAVQADDPDGTWAALETNLPATPPENELTLPTAGPKSLFKIGLEL